MWDLTGTQRLWPIHRLVVMLKFLYHWLVRSKSNFMKLGEFRENILLKNLEYSVNRFLGFVERFMRTPWLILKLYE